MDRLIGYVFAGICIYLGVLTGTRKAQQRRYIGTTLSEESEKGARAGALSIWLVGIAAAIAGFAVGVWFPQHHYQQYANSRYLLDTKTGLLCDPIRWEPSNPLDAATSAQAVTNPPYCGR